MISVICASFNCESEINFTFRSLRQQSYKDFEVIVIDGKSTDNTVAEIKKNDDIVTYFVSEKDDGIADAWNKGINQAKGDIICFLNFGDYYHPEFLFRVNEALKEKSAAITYGVCNFISNGSIVGKISGELNDSLIKGMGFVHTSCACTSDVFDKIGLFNTKYRIAIDTDFLIRALNEGVEFIKTDATVYMGLGGVSDRHAKRAYFEFLGSLKEHDRISYINLKYMKLLYLLYSVFRPIKKSIYLRIFLRKQKHFLVFLMNLFHQLIPTMILKRLYLRKLGFEIGKQTYILRGAKFYGLRNFKIGKNCIVNRNCLIDNRAKVSIGDNVSIAHRVSIYTGGHDFNSPFNDLTLSPVLIKDYAQVFSNVLIMPGVSIGRGAVVLPGSVVTKDVEDYVVVGGAPAVPVKKRSCDLVYKDFYPFWYAL